MMDDPHGFVAAVLEQLGALGLGHPLRVIRTIDPEDDSPRLDFHVTGVPREDRRAVEDLLLRGLIECEEGVGFANSIGFVHDVEFDAAALEQVTGDVLAILDPCVRTVASSACVWSANETVREGDTRLGVAA
jgi:hypothetical protein